MSLAMTPAPLERLNLPPSHDPSLPLLAISERRKSGLILCKAFHAEFVGPGAAINSSVEQPYQAIIAIGSPELVPAVSLEERRKAYGLRIQWGRWLYKIADQTDSVQRVEKLFAGFEGFFGRQVVMRLPSEVLAMLVGVLPSTIDQIRQRDGLHLDRATLLFPSTSLKIATVSLPSLAQSLTVPSQGYTQDHNMVAPLEVPLETTATLRDIKSAYAALRRSA
ncbi:MAG: hypothetical protein VKJ24_10560 [Synechococcales bacterium]|nr:hypothetical protein [Synechococcales bacterium]